MIRNKIFALRLAAAAGICGAALFLFSPAANAQIGSQAGPQPGPSPVPLSQQVTKVHYQVVRMGYDSIQVANPANQRELHTFVYSPKIRDKMRALFNAGGYQYGDRVTVWHQRGGDVALKIKGKPSKRH